MKKREERERKIVKKKEATSIQWLAFFQASVGHGAQPHSDIQTHSSTEHVLTMPLGERLRELKERTRDTKGKKNKTNHRLRAESFGLLLLHSLQQTRPCCFPGLPCREDDSRRL